MEEPKQGGEQINIEGESGGETVSEPIVPTEQAPKTDQVSPQVPPTLAPADLPAPAVPVPLPIIEETEEKKEIKSDKKYIEEAEEIIKKYDEDPHTEEESAEDLQIELLDKKYHKKLEKGEE